MAEIIATARLTPSILKTRASQQVEDSVDQDLNSPQKSREAARAFLYESTANNHPSKDTVKS